jgi:hypothetical protein
VIPQLCESQVCQLCGEAYGADAAVDTLQHDVRGLDISVDDLELVEVLEATEDVDEHVRYSRPFQGALHVHTRHFSARHHSRKGCHTAAASAPGRVTV